MTPDDSTVIVDYGVGNLASARNMLRRIGAGGVVTGDSSVIADARRVILPGVGAFDTAMQNLEERKLLPVLEKKALAEKVPFLGICLGMQLLTRGSEEGRRPGLGWIDAETVRFPEGSSSLKVPHMGWNVVSPLRDHPLFDGMPEEIRFYFVHSYHVRPADDDLALATTEHGSRFVSAVGRENLLGVQFHPEKSHRFGMQLFQNFLQAPPCSERE